jgi:hypothetical protein
MSGDVSSATLGFARRTGGAFAAALVVRPVSAGLGFAAAPACRAAGAAFAAAGESRFCSSAMPSSSSLQ